MPKTTTCAQVNGPHDFQRVGGTALGGGTFLGLCRLLTQVRDFDEAMNCAGSGNSNAVNLLVKYVTHRVSLVLSSWPQQALVRDVPLAPASFLLTARSSCATGTSTEGT